MGHVTIEIKARCAEPDRIRKMLSDRDAEILGLDRQRDTYFNVPRGRLKLREGEIENALIFYDRDQEAGPKRSDVMLYHPEPGSTLKSILTHALGVDVIVEKLREIFFIDNVKFHIDEVRGLGSFIEIEAIDLDGAIGTETLRRQCGSYLELFDLPRESLIAESYSDMLRPGSC